MNGPPTNAPSVMQTRVWCSTASRSSSRLSGMRDARRGASSTAVAALGPKYLSDQSARCSAMFFGSAQRTRSSAGASKISSPSSAGGVTSGGVWTVWSTLTGSRLTRRDRPCPLRSPHLVRRGCRQAEDQRGHDGEEAVDQRRGHGLRVARPEADERPGQRELLDAEAARLIGIEPSARISVQAAKASATSTSDGPTPTARSVKTKNEEDGELARDRRHRSGTCQRRRRSTIASARNLHELVPRPADGPLADQLT